MKAIKIIKKLLVASGVILIFIVFFVHHFLKVQFCTPPHISSHLVNCSIQINHKTRYINIVEPAVKLKDSVSLVFVFGPANESEYYMQNISNFYLDSIYDHQNVLLCYAKPYKGFWNDRLTKVNSAAVKENMNESLYFQEIIKFINRKYRITVKNTFLIGLSQGGEMVYRLCLDLPDQVCAAVVVAANLHTSYDISKDTISNKAINMLIINGKLDPICPYEGGEVTLYHLVNRGKVYSALTTHKFWAKKAGYTEEPHLDTIINKKKKIVATTFTYNTPQKKQVILYALTEGGHTFPHPNTNAPILFGKTVHDINAAELAVNFFKKIDE